MPPFSCNQSRRNTSMVRSYSWRRCPARLTQVVGVGNIATVFTIGLITPIPPEMPGSIPTIKLFGICFRLSPLRSKVWRYPALVLFDLEPEGIIPDPGSDHEIRPPWPSHPERQQVQDRFAVKDSPQCCYGV